MEELLCHLLCGGLPGVGDLPGLGAGAGLAESGPRELHRELKQMLVSYKGICADSSGGHKQGPRPVATLKKHNEVPTSPERKGMI